MTHAYLRPALLAAALFVALPLHAAPADKADADCSALPNHAALRAAVKEAQAASNAAFGLHMWAALVNRAGVVCAVAFSGDHWGDQWPGSRVIAAQKASTANSFSLPKLAMATANLYTITQPGGFAFGIQESNPLVPEVAYKGPAARWGQANDPMVGQRVGGVNVFGGGLPLYNDKGVLVGAMGTSGDSSCADHFITWRMRHALKLDYVPGGVGAGGVDQIAFSGQWAQPHCGDAKAEDAVVAGLPAVRKVSP